MSNPFPDFDRIEQERQAKRNADVAAAQAAIEAAQQQMLATYQGFIDAAEQSAEVQLTSKQGVVDADTAVQTAKQNAEQQLIESTKQATERLQQLKYIDALRS